MRITFHVYLSLKNGNVKNAFLTVLFPFPSKYLGNHLHRVKMCVRCSADGRTQGGLSVLIAKRRDRTFVLV